MGTYTEFKTKEIYLRLDTPVEVIDFIRECIDDNPFLVHDAVTITTNNPIFEHPFFKEERWARVFGSISFPEFHENYQKPYIKKKGKYWVLFIWTDIKSGIGEVLAFVDWIAPFVSGHKPREYIGWWRTENYDAQINAYIERKDPQADFPYIAPPPPDPFPPF